MSFDASKYETSEHGNFRVIDTIGVPHPFTIGPKHVEHASDKHGGMLGEATCRAVPCAHPRCRLTYEQHEKALLVSCKVEIKDGDKANPELHAYLLKIKDQCEADGYVGFAFMKEE